LKIKIVEAIAKNSSTMPPKMADEVRAFIYLEIKGRI